jgi:membrane protein YdbS with pleckstrin-like domain
MADPMADPNTPTQVVTSEVAMVHPASAEPVVEEHGPAVAQAPRVAAAEQPAGDRPGTGLDGEETIWEARYSLKNFLFRFALAGALVLAWVALAVATWGTSQPNIAPAITIILGILLGIGLLLLLRRVVLARFGHHYHLTNRRLFVATGVLNRRRDQMELLKVDDVYIKQSLMQRWLRLGTVVVVSQEPHFPVMYLTGIDDPEGVMNLVWHHARLEREGRAAEVDQV